MTDPISCDCHKCEPPMPSPLPYRANIHCPCAEVLDANGEIVAVCEKSPRPKENAEFVARACNCHAEFISVVRCLVELVDPDGEPILELAIKNAKSALARAKSDA